MAKRRILTVELTLPFGDDVEIVPFNSDVSVLDWDIVLFWPDASQFIDRALESYQGKPLLGEDVSFRFRDRCQHWNRELAAAIDAGKTVVVFLEEPQEVYVDTGNREYSGTGRNQRTTRMVEPYSSYRAIPANLETVKARGKKMSLAQGADLLRGYWKRFADLSEYQIRLSKALKKPLVVTKEGSLVVGCMQHTASGGALVLLPALVLTESLLWKKKPGTKDDWEWTKKAREIAANLASEVLSLDAALHSASDVTPAPPWIDTPLYTLPAEADLRQQLLRTEASIERLQQKKQDLQAQLSIEVELKNLLYGTGKPLEAAILKALRLLGFQAENYRDSQSEFDAVFESPEGRLLGEAEGKDSKPVNIDKLRQLEMNIQEDFARDEVSAPAKGVLFGNAFRIAPPDERADYFTEKVYSAAQRSGYALVRTPDLFAAVRQLVTTDPEFARRCREAILNTNGQVVSFPAFPEPTGTSDIREGDV